MEAKNGNLIIAARFTAKGHQYGICLGIDPSSNWRKKNGRLSSKREGEKGGRKQNIEGSRPRARAFEGIKERSCG